MITENINYDATDLSGTITIVAEPGYLSELLALWTELGTRQNVIEGVTVIARPPAPTPTPDPGPDDGSGSDPSAP